VLTAVALPMEGILLIVKGAHLLKRGALLIRIGENDKTEKKDEV